MTTHNYVRCTLNEEKLRLESRLHSTVQTLNNQIEEVTRAKQAVARAESLRDKIASDIRTCGDKIDELAAFLRILGAQ